jgi:surface antigen
MKSPRMKSRFISVLLPVMLLGLVTMNADAINLMFLSKESPARRFSDADWQYLNRAIDHSLEKVGDGASYRWDNPKSPASGLIEMLESSKEDDMPCRRMRMTNHYDDIKGVTEFVFCKQPDGEWKVLR